MLSIQQTFIFSGSVSYNHKVKQKLIRFSLLLPITMSNSLSNEPSELKNLKGEQNKQENENSDILETILKHVGEMGLYQKLLFVGMGPFGVFFAFVYFVQMFITATPQRHWCRVPELEHLDIELRRNLTTPRIGELWDRCNMYDVNWTQVLLNFTIPEGTPTVPCKYGWEFELGDIPYETIVSERNWVCDKAGYAPVAQSIFFVGSLCGGIFFGWMADYYGRVPSLVGTNIMALIGGIATIYSTGLWDFAFYRFIVGTSYDSCFMTMYILVLEYVGPKYRTWVGNLSLALYFGGGCLLLPWLAIWVGDWRKLLWIISLPFVIVVIVPFTVPESARWLSSRGRVNDAVKVLRRFEKVNGTKIPEDVMDEFIGSANQNRPTNESMMDVVKSGPLRKMMFLMVVVYMACAVIFDGLVRMSDDLGLDFFVTFTLTSTMEIPSVILLACILEKFGRRALSCGPMAAAGVLIMTAAFVPKGVTQVILAIMSRFMINMAFNVAIQRGTELLPTPVRATGCSLMHVSGYVATLVSPLIVFSRIYWAPLPFFVLGIISLAASTANLFLPETKGISLPQTIEEGEIFFNSYSLCGKAEDTNDIQVAENEKALIA